MIEVRGHTSTPPESEVSILVYNCSRVAILTVSGLYIRLHVNDTLKAYADVFRA